MYAIFLEEPLHGQKRKKSFYQKYLEKESVDHFNVSMKLDIPERKKIGKLPTNYLGVFDHFVGLALKGLRFFLTQKIFKGKNNLNNLRQVIFSLLIAIHPLVVM